MTLLLILASLVLANPSGQTTVGVEPEQRHLDVGLYSDLTIAYVPGDVPAFDLAGIDLFARTKDYNGVSGLVEVIFGEHGPTLHLARAQIDGRVNQRLKIRVGQFDAPIGDYIPTTPHGGSVFRLAVERPRLLSIEPGEETLALHMLGLQAMANGRLGDAGELRFDLAYGDDAVHVGSAHGVKPIAGRLGFVPSRGPLAGALLGVSYYIDRVHVEHYKSAYYHLFDLFQAYATAEAELPAEEVGETYRWRQVAVAYVAYDAFPIELRSEGYYAANADHAFGAETNLTGGLLLAGYTRGLTTPYARVHGFTRVGRDAVFHQSVPHRWLDAALGVRYAAHERVVLKLQAGTEFFARELSVQGQVAFGI